VQVSSSDGFNIATADAMAQGIAKDYRTYVAYIDELKKVTCLS
jgi:hypothetical protein